MADNERKRRNGIEGKEKTKTVVELQSESEDLKALQDLYAAAIPLAYMDFENKKYVRLIP